MAGLFSDAGEENGNRMALAQADARRDFQKRRGGFFQGEANEGGRKITKKSNQELILDLRL
jgi:hypothetical protein